MKFKDLILAAVAACMLGSAGIAAAQSLAYVDARRLIDEAPQGRDEIQKLEEQFSERNRELKGQIEQFNAEEAELQKNAVLLSSEELQEKTRIMRDRQIQLKREQQNYNEDYSRARNESLARLEKLISEVIIELAKEENIGLVVQQAVYASPDIDLTGKVLERLQKMHGQ